VPKWGVTQEDRDPARPDRWPWKLEPRWLAPAKTITDPVHRHIHLTVLETALLSSPPMRRLARVRQLGTAHLVYPGAVHSRLAHALGTLRATQDLLDAIADARNSPHPPERDFLAGLGDEERAKTLAEATVAARLGGLLHDLCHVPFGHTIEDDLKVLIPHDANKARFDVLWAQLPEAARLALDTADGGALKDELLPLILSKAGQRCPECGEPDQQGETPPRYPFVGDIVGNTICADLIDYLHRDHHFTGLPVALGDRFLDGFYVMDADHVHFAKRMVVQVSRDGQPRADVLSELVKYLRYRYELSERVLNHHAKTAADAMLSKMLDMWTDDLFAFHAQDVHGRRVIPDAAIDDIGDVRERVRAADPTPVRAPDGRASSAGVLAIEDRVSAEVERLFRTRSDDGLLEQLAELPADARPGGARREAVRNLASDLLDRRLFKRAATAGGTGDRALADDIYAKFGSAQQRREIESAAMTFAGLPKEWRLVLWVPEPRMRMKIANVLCDNNGHVAPLHAIGDNDSDRVLEQHKRLWSVVVYAHPDLRSTIATPQGRRQQRQLMAALSYVRDRMDLALTDWEGLPVPTRRRFAVELVGEYGQLPRDRREKLVAAQSAALGAGTADDLLMTVWHEGQAAGFYKTAFPGAKIWTRR
jgi:HD superfamily phosphohydrolase